MLELSWYSIKNTSPQDRFTKVVKISQVLINPKFYPKIHPNALRIKFRFT